MPNAQTEVLAPRVVTAATDPALIERVLLHGDLRQLTPAQKVSYYHAVCSSVGLNPITQPFQYLVLNGKEILYATRAATEQLRFIHTVSVQIMAREVMEDCYIVTARATLPNGRQDENIGAVPIAGLKGESRANAMMKAETKAKRRVTLAICGLGMLDETEVESIPGVALPTIQLQPINSVPPPQSGELLQTPTSTGVLGNPAASTVDYRGTQRESRSPDGDGPSAQRTSANASASGVAQRGEHRGGIPKDAQEHRAAGTAGSEPADSHTREPGDDDDGLLRVVSVQTQPTKNPNVLKALINFSDGRVRSTINTMLINAAAQCLEDGTPVLVEDKQTRWGWDLVKLTKAGAA